MSNIVNSMSVNFDRQLLYYLKVYLTIDGEFGSIHVESRLHVNRIVKHSGSWHVCHIFSKSEERLFKQEWLDEIERRVVNTYGLKLDSRYI